MSGKSLLIGRTIIGRTITECRPMTDEEMRAEGWHACSRAAPTMLVFDDGTKLYPSSDQEGNDGGCLFGIDPAGVAFRIW